MSEHETLESSVSLTTLQIHIYILQIMPLRYSLRLCDSTAFLCIFPMESVFITGSFHPAVCPFPHQPPAGTGGISHRLSPAWTWSQSSPTQQHICVALSPPDGIQNESCSPSRARGLFGLFPRHNVPHLAAGFSPRPTVGAGSS